MRLAEILLESNPHPYWRIIRQVGVQSAVGVLPRHFADWRQSKSELPWDYGALAMYKSHIETAGFTLEVIEDSPPMDCIRLGKPGRDEELAQFKLLLENMGRLDIPVLCYNWMPVLGWLRTSLATPGRAGALVSGYDHEVLSSAPNTSAGQCSDNELWSNLEWFLERIIPVAEESNVKLAMHPDDPPLSPIRGIARILRSVESFERLLDISPSDANGITLCQGNFALMTDDLPAAIRRLGESRRIHFVHFRDVRGTPTSFVETFHDDGQTDMAACIRAYVDIGFDGPMRTDHVPLLDGDTAAVPGYSWLGRLFAVGYARGLIDSALYHATAHDSLKEAAAG
jgi:mannonate dehydratase